MGKQTKKTKKQSDDEQVQDIMAWGKSKQNYYQQSEHEYSQASQQQDQAKKIYQNQYQQLNINNYYQLPDEKSNIQLSQNQQNDEEEEGTINDQYINSQILWATQLAKLFQQVQDQQSQFKKKVNDSYLLILLALKQFKIPHMDQHPLVKNLPILKNTLRKFQNQVMIEYEKNLNQQQQQQEEDYEQNHDQDEDEDEENGYNDEENIQNSNSGDMDQMQIEQAPPKYNKNKKLKQSKQDKEGLQLYNRLKRTKQQEKKVKKIQNKQKRQKNLPKQAFRLVSEHEGRLANQKILKNKILMKKRGRDAGNSRTKLRHKYQKALVRRKAKGYNGVKQNPGRYYQGQNKVLYGKIASTKLN